MKCKNCGKEIYCEPIDIKFPRKGYQWYHKSDGSRYCKPEKIAEPEGDVK